MPTRPNSINSENLHPKTDPSLLVRCEPLPTYPEDPTQLGKFLKENFTYLQLVYTECAIRMDCLIEADTNNEQQTCPEDKLKDVQQQLQQFKEQGKHGTG